MCYFLYLASPLTLSEVRSMLPSGLTADLASFSQQQTLKALHAPAQTVARILSGRCSCDLVRTRLTNTKDDERHLRERYRRLGTPRPEVIARLERHRLTSAVRPSRESSQVELSNFVVEHARNAGPTLYLLAFEPDDTTARGDTGKPPKACPLSEVHLDPGGWLAEGVPTLVSR